MSYTFLVEQEGVSSAECFSDIPASVLSRLNLTAAKSCCNANETKSCPGSQSGMTCEPSTASHGEDSLTSCAEGGPVRTSPLAVQPKAGLMENGADYGEKWLGSLAKFDPVTHSLKTRQTLLFSDSTECLVTF